MNYYPDKYTEWESGHRDNSDLDMNYLREETNKTILRLRNGGY